VVIKDNALCDIGQAVAVQVAQVIDDAIAIGVGEFLFNQVKPAVIVGIGVSAVG